VTNGSHLLNFRRLFLFFIAGLLLGWLVIGWLVWPVHWVNTKPSELLPEYQKVYIQLVAGEYWRDRNITFVREALKDWDEQALAKILEQMLNEADTTEEIEQLTELASIMSLPDASLSIWDMMLEPQNKVLLLTASFSVLLFAGAMTLGISSILRSGEQTQEVTLSDFQDEIPTEANDGLKELFPGTDGAGEEDEDKTTQTADNAEQFEYDEDFKSQDTVDTSVDSEDESDETQKDDQDNDSEYSDDLLLDDEAEEDSQMSTGALFSFFEEEDSIFPELEALCKDLPEVDIDELFKLGTDIIRQFEMGLKETY
jgi:hypothetical protein